MPNAARKFNEEAAIDEVFSIAKSLFDEIVEETERPTIKAWDTSLDEIFDNTEFRLDATHYDPQVAEIRTQLASSGYDVVPLADLANVSLRNQFTRIWARDEKHGYKYLNATDLLSLMALGVPGNSTRYLSHVTETNIDALIINEGWLLMTCSGTIGRVFYVPERLDGWVATHDLIRIVPHDEKMTGFLMAWLNSKAAQAQIMSHTHGGQIDHVTDAQVGRVLVPILPDSVIARIHTDTINALKQREAALESLMRVWQETDNVFRSE